MHQEIANVLIRNMGNRITEDLVVGMLQAITQIVERETSQQQSAQAQQGS